jgi:hypothetical protein
MSYDPSNELVKLKEHLDAGADLVWSESIWDDI